MHSLRSVGIIMDGNRRWAKARGLPTLEGHRTGLKKVKELAEWAKDAGIEEVTLYAFSTENWKRSPEEVNYLMKLFEDAFGKELGEVVEKGFRIRFIGERGRLPLGLQALIEETEKRTAGNARGTIAIALSYGGRAEILDAVNRLMENGRISIDEESLRNAMWSAGLSDPDLIVRTGGEKRLSNFLMWQSAYSELFFTDTLWPDFSKEEFDSILASFRKRERREGA